MVPGLQDVVSGGRVLRALAAPDPPPAIAGPEALYLADVATTANHGLTGLTALNGVTLVDGVTLVLVRAQTAGTQNGLFTPHTGAWSRVVSSSASYMVQVLGGTLLSRTLWMTADGTTFVNPYAAIPSSGVTAGSYTNMSGTVGADGRLTAASSGFPGVNPATFLIMAGIQNNGYLQLKTRPAAEITNFTVTAADSIIEVDTSGFAPVGGRFVGTLPAANAVNSAANPLRWWLWVNDVGGGAAAKPIRLQTLNDGVTNFDTINGGVTTFVDMASNGGAFFVTSNGVSKFTIQKLTGA